MLSQSVPTKWFVIVGILTFRPIPRAPHDRFDHAWMDVLITGGGMKATPQKNVSLFALMYISSYTFSMLFKTCYSELYKQFCGKKSLWYESTIHVRV